MYRRPIEPGLGSQNEPSTSQRITKRTKRKAASESDVNINQPEEIPQVPKKRRAQTCTVCGELRKGHICAGKKK